MRQRNSMAFTIPGRLTAWQRVVPRGRHGTPWMPAETRNTQAMVRSLALNVMQQCGLFSGALEMQIDVRRIPPKSWSKKKRKTARYITSKPDNDNYAKTIGDALNGVVYGDDAQIAKLLVTKEYMQTGCDHVLIRIAELEDSNE